MGAWGGRERKQKNRGFKGSLRIFGLSSRMVDGRLWMVEQFTKMGKTGKAQVCPNTIQCSSLDTERLSNLSTSGIRDRAGFKHRPVRL